MQRHEIINELKNIISDYLRNRDLDLVDFIYRYEGRDLILRILVDKPQSGISLDECAYLNSQMSNILDEKDIIKNRYILEVSSPGLDRPLKTKNDFLRCINRKVRVFLYESINGKMELEGLINRIDEGSVYIDIEGQILKIPLSKITKAKQVV